MGARVLVIEDNAANLELMTYLLTAFGHAPEGVRDGRQGVDAVLRRSFDLVVCDIQLPELDGFEVAQAIRRGGGSATPLVAVTAFAQVGDRERVLAAGFDGYISKPIVPETFVQQVEAYLPSELHGRAAEPAPPPSQREASPRPACATILVVDNVPENVQLMRDLLEPFAYRVSDATGLNDAVRKVQDCAPDLIVCDVHLGDGTGFELLDTVKHMRGLERVPFVLTSSTTRGTEDAARGRALGARKFIVTPIDASALLAQIQECLESR